MRRRRLILIAVAVASMVPVLLGVAARIDMRNSSSPGAGLPSPGVDRFLQLTGGGGGAAPGSSNTSGAAAATKATAAAPPADANELPNGWHLTPAGIQVAVPRFPLGETATPDGSKLIVSSDSGGVQAVSVIDTASPPPVGVATPAANLFMGVAALPDGTVYASGGNADRVFRFHLAGPALVHEDLTNAAVFPVHNAADGVLGQVSGQNPPPNAPAGDGIRVNRYPATLLTQGGLLYAAGNVSEPTGTGGETCPSGEPICSRVSIVDTTTNAVIGRAPVGLDAYGLALDPQRHLLYVSNWADQVGRGNLAGGTVSVVDVSNPRAPVERGVTVVGHHPSAVQLSADRTRLFVANTNDDTISVLALGGSGAPTVVATESTRPLSAVPVGSHPDAMTLSPDGNTLFVALAGMNAVEARDGHTGARVKGTSTYIPTGWYPSALAVTGNAAHYRLWVANAKGIGFGTGANGSVLFEGTTTGGTVSGIDLPVSAAQERAWSQQVVRDDGLDTAGVNPCAPQLHPSEVLCPPKGTQSPIKHVIYIVTENKTFDQYFGDLSPAQGYDADPSYAIYGNNVTPNHHKLAAAYSLGDRFFSDAEVSVTGHSWTSGAIATDHNEKTWPADYDQGVRGTHGGGDPLRPSIASGCAPSGNIGCPDDVLNDPQGGYIFEAFRRAGAQPPETAGAKLTMGIYGEHTARDSGDMSAYQAKGRNKDGSVAYWKAGDIQYFDTCRAREFITGKAPDGPAPDNNDYFGDCAGRTLDPQFTLAHWASVLKNTGKDVMPNFIYMSLPDNHTLGTNLGSPTPASMVADNDYALGLLVDALSRSPFWSSTVFMQTEDDTQAAGDHISPLRDYLSVIGPWAQPGVEHQWGSMPALLRTIEQLFHVAPITLYDRLATPEHSAFLARLSDKPNLAPYTVVTPLVPFAVNQPGAAGQSISAKLDFSTVDRVDEGILSAILWADATHTPLRLPPDAAGLLSASP